MRVVMCNVQSLRISSRSISFLLPVCIDDTSEAEALVPDKFKALHITRVPAGEPAPEFVARLLDLCNARRA